MPNPPSKPGGSSSIFPILSKKHEIVMFSSTAIALYGYDQGMMSLINTNNDYLKTMQIGKESPLVGIIVSVYYLGCAIGAVIASWLADREGRKPSIFACLATTSFGNLLMFISGLSMTGSSPWKGGALGCMIAGRIIMGLGVGGIDATIPVYKMNIFGLLVAYSINLGVTIGLGKDNQWAWRSPIIIMQIFPVLLMSFIAQLPETPRWFMSVQREDDAKKALEKVYGKEEAKSRFEILQKSTAQENDSAVQYRDMFTPGHAQFHPTMVTIMGQINQALTGYGAVSVYGPQIFELLGFTTRKAEFLTLGNYVSYFLMMTFAWLSIDVYGRRKLMIWGSAGLSISFLLLTLFGHLAPLPNIPTLSIQIPGSLTLFIATAIFGIGWLTTVWLIPTEIYPSSARAQGSAISVIIWGLANFTVTLLTPIGFNNLKYWLFLVFALTNTFAGWWTWKYSLESGGRSFEENQEFFECAERDGSWVVKEVDGGKFVKMPRKGKGKDKADEEGNGENEPLLRRG
ncbi:hypothetical protein EYC80_007203 [Monilinia laxa]|uniref:Major facilitator superfamily (MFS) profile domain-containing protein n=1 Tax=Monilinia laxa TaxID=61186 RepID=A0A5N6K0J1_MONLA|nr:hypothetical protein EYC80_007203 [Monilinia laxa]